MIIGLDGGPLSVTDDRLKVGVWRVAHNLVKELPRISVKDLYRVYRFGRGGESGSDAIGDNIQYVPLPRAGFHSLWQTADIFKTRIDAYIGLAQTFPPLPNILCDVKKIGMLYDTGFLDHPEYYPDSVKSLTKHTANLVSASDRIITISEASKKAIIRRYDVIPEKITVAYLGVEEVFRKKGPVYKQKHPYVLFVGALKRGKNVPTMIRAFAAFLKEYKKKCDLLLVGSDFWLDPGISQTIEALGLKHCVQIVGYVDDQKLASFYRGARALLSVSLVEGFGLPAVEAMATGAPVIASSVGSYPEVVGNAGILVNPHKADEITAAILRLEKNSSFRNNCICRGRKLSERFRWNYFAQIVRNSIQ